MSNIFYTFLIFLSRDIFFSYIHQGTCSAMHSSVFFVPKILNLSAPSGNCRAVNGKIQCRFSKMLTFYLLFKPATEKDLKGIVKHNLNK